jgi:hypothetical protein
LKPRIKYVFAVVVGIYLLSNIGIPVFYHYCGGELESINTICNYENDCCEGEDESEPDDCCKNETKIISQKSETSFKDFQLKFMAGSAGALIPVKSRLFNESVILSQPRASSYQFSSSGRSILQLKSVLII